MTAARVANIIDRAGETVTLRRLPSTDVSVKASIRQNSASDLVAEVIQGSADIHISNREIAAASWPGPPRKGDQIIRDGTYLTVEECETRNYREETALYILRVTG